MKRNYKKEEFFAQLDPAKNQGLLFDYTPNLLYFIKNTESEFITANPALIQKLGLQLKSDITGTNDYDYFPHYIVERFLADDQLVFETGKNLKNRMELITHIDYSVDWHLTHKIPILSYEGKIIGLQGITLFIEPANIKALPYPQIYEAIDFIRNNYMEKINIPDLGKMSGLSTSSFERQFKSHFQMTPLKYIRRMRINKACDLLESTSKPVSEIALEVGFCDQSYFTSEFRKSMKISPSKFRKKKSNLTKIQ